MKAMLRRFALIAMLTVTVSCDSTGPTSRHVPEVPEVPQVPALVPIRRGQIVLVDQSGSRYAIFIADSNGVRLKSLSPGSSTDFDPAVSADGKKIAFTSVRPFEPGDIWVMNADGTNPVRLTQTTNNVGSSNSPAWSPDGKRIAFVRTAGLWKHEIFVMNADGTDVTQLTSEDEAYSLSPEWSSDGSRILYAHFPSRVEQAGIYEMNPDGTNVRQLTSGHFDMEPARSPDGTRIAFIRRQDLFVMNADGSNAKAVTSGVDWETSVTWSPDGKSILFGIKSASKTCYSWADYEEYACGRDLKRVSVDGAISSSWIVTGGFDAAWQR